MAPRRVQNGVTLFDDDFGITPSYQTGPATLTEGTNTATVVAIE